MSEKNAPPPIPPEVIEAWNRMHDAALSFEERQKARAKLGMPEAKGDTVRIVRALSPTPASIAAERLSGLVLDTTEAGIRAKLIELGWTPPEWQSIDTAPKDGTPILAFLPIERQQAVVMWDMSGTRAAVAVEVGYMGHWRANLDVTDELWLCDPSHWKPLGPNL